jgi:hypothetical protein
MRRSGELIASFYSILNWKPRHTLPLKLRRCTRLFLPICITPRRQRSASTLWTSLIKWLTVLRKSHCKYLQQLGKARSTAGRGDPSASTSAKPSLGEDQTHFSSMRQDCVGRPNQKELLAVRPRGSIPSQETLHVRED